MLFFLDIPNAKLIAVILFFIAASTDFLDGFAARKYNAVTEWGAFFDPLADKVLTSAAFVLLGILEIAPIWTVCLIILRDILATYFRIYSEKRNLIFKTSLIAKCKTFIQMFFISFILWILLIQNLDISPQISEMCYIILYSKTVYWTIISISALTVWTLIDYLKKPSQKKI